jgi:hypothetical protein
MTPDQRDLFSKSFARELVQKANGSGDPRDIVNLFNSPAMREKMQLAMGPDNANQVEAYLRRESAMNMLRTAATGNSTTARQLVGLLGAVGERAAGPTSGAIAGAATALYQNGTDPWAIAKGAAVGALTGAMAHGVARSEHNIATRVGQMLASDDPATIQQAVRTVGQNPQLLANLRKFETTLALTAARQAPVTNNDTPYHPHQNFITTAPAPLPRASGGRATVNHAARAKSLISAAQRAKKAQSKATEPMLNVPDAAIAKALRIANKHI